MFDFFVQLDVTRRRCVVVGSGPQARERADALRASGAHVQVLAADRGEDLADLDDGIVVRRRGYEPGDLDGVFLAVVTLEDATDVASLWAEAEERGVLVSTLDDVEHCHFAAPAMVRRGDLKIAVGTAGRAPALAKRLRRRLEDELGPEYGDLVDVLHAARDDALPRTVGFDDWARRWACALDDVDALAALVAQGRHDEVRARILDAITGDAGGGRSAHPAPRAGSASG